jgi:O-acetyl-ADP-ribose deacetylase (regulator of RNase III)
MPIHYIVGDLFANENNAQAYAYDCNIEGVVNTDCAIQFRSRYPKMMDEYQRLCAVEELDSGDVFLWQARDGMWVFNVATLETQFLKLANRKSIERAYRKMRKQAEDNNIESIAMPPVGGGIGGLYWGKSRRSLERAFKGWDGNLYVYMK